MSRVTSSGNTKTQLTDTWLYNTEEYIPDWFAWLLKLDILYPLVKPALWGAAEGIERNLSPCWIKFERVFNAAWI